MQEIKRKEQLYIAEWQVPARMIHSQLCAKDKRFAIMPSGMAIKLRRNTLKTALAETPWIVRFLNKWKQLLKQAR